MVRQAAPFFPGRSRYDPDAVEKQWKDRPADAAPSRGTGPPRDRRTRGRTETLEAALRALAAERGVAAGKIFQPLRVALTGMTVSPGIFEVLVTMGPQLTTKRLEDAYDS